MLNQKAFLVKSRWYDKKKKIKRFICCLGENDAFRKEVRRETKLILDIKIHRKTEC